MKLFVALVAASAAASKQSVSTLSADVRSVLRAELAAWRKEFEPAAASLGVLPQAMMSMSPHDALQRFYDNKLAIEEASRNNLDATFDYNNPFALMTQADAFHSVPEADMNVRSVMEASVDWTTGKCVDPVRVQGLCNTGWAFVAVGAAEMAHCLVTGKRLDLSEQQVTSCSTEYEGWALLGERLPSYSCTKKQLSISATVRTSSEAALDTALNTQPVSVPVEAGNSVWRNYRKGVIKQCPGSYSDHAVVAVGYDEESYKVRNSCGANWGDGGYVRL
ncbi:hypothetical protein H310_13494 [Aphanomyces invadans]|uniref:Peptidase C1A papain C-terminal domain-containing protein n=1 Tax=Aphanomyces invadans TaxID=157072 RepID=A0A024TDE3_9STRA|nr:hypothetical protein H310_13494 [Aphanomyces invadans]ETV92073.1 hypothetical protein H310_13494 [Aphanomyces invadans]|eukprot:XP_008879235.1 hypothetical protein H310_13494 [Aphanomyces invadans]